MSLTARSLTSIPTNRPSVDIAGDWVPTIEYPLTNRTQNRYLRDNPNVRKNKIHSDKVVASKILGHLGCTNRVVPAGQIGERLDDFICFTYCDDYVLMGKSIETSLETFVQVGDSLSFKITKGRPKLNVLVVTVDVMKNRTVLVQTYKVSMVYFNA